MHHTENKDLHACIATCWECRNECQETLFNHCLEKGGKHVEAAHVRLMADCIQACQTAADFMVRGSQFHASECAACVIQTIFTELTLVFALLDTAMK